MSQLEIHGDNFSDFIFISSKGQHYTKSVKIEAGKTYTFNNPSGHPLVFSTTSDGTHSGGIYSSVSNYTDGVTKVSSTETTLSVTSTTPVTLYYYCSVHSGMGGKIKIIQ